MKRLVPIIILTTTGLLPAGAGATVWSDPKTVSEAGRYRFINIGAMAVGGDRSVVTWTRGGPGHEIRAARAIDRGNFGRSFALRTQRSALGDAAAAVDGRGNGFIAYRRLVGHNHRIEYRAVRPNGSRTIPDLLSGAGDSAYGPTFATAPGQPPALAWWRRTPERIQETRFPGATRFDVSTVTLPGSTDAGYALQADGTLLAAVIANSRVQVAARSAGPTGRGEFGPLTPVSANGIVRSAHIAVGPGDSAAVVWRQFDGSTYRLMAAHRARPSAPFSEPIAISSGGERASEPAIAITSGGKALAAYLSSRPGGGEASTGALRLVDIRTGASRTLDATATGASIAVDDHDRATVTWLHARSGGRGPVYAATTAISSISGAVRKLTARGEHAMFAPVLGASREDKGFRVAWTSTGGKVRAVRR